MLLSAISAFQPLAYVVGAWIVTFKIQEPHHVSSCVENNAAMQTPRGRVTVAVGVVEVRGVAVVAIVVGRGTVTVVVGGVR